MAKAEATVGELVSKIERGELRLPEMQRHFRPSLAYRMALEDKAWPLWQEAEAAYSKERGFHQDRFFVRDPGGNRLEILEPRRPYSSAH